MLEMIKDRLQFSFPEVHPDAKLSVEFQRTLRIPDDGSAYPLPPGLGRFPLRQVDDFASSVPRKWLEHGGVMLPMYQSEALWVNFNTSYCRSRSAAYPFLVKIAAGKVNAVTGAEWTNDPSWDPQDYLVVPEQPWLDGYCVEKGYIRQFVATPLGSGYSAEEQLTGESEHGGLQIAAFPMKREAFERRYPEHRGPADAGIESLLCSLHESAAPDMGLAPGGRMRQEIYEDPFEPGDWDLAHVSRCFVHICNSLVWRSITEENPPTVPPTASEYEKAGLPWFDYYGGDAKALKGSGKLKGLKSVLEMGKQKGDAPIPENEPVTPELVVTLRRGLAKQQVREGRF
jgi:hypothetical protein